MLSEWGGVELKSQVSGRLSQARGSAGPPNFRSLFGGTPMLYHNVRVMAQLLGVVDAGAIAIGSLGAWYAGWHMGAWSGESTGLAITVFSLTVLALFPVLGTRLQLYHARRTESLRTELVQLIEVALYAIGLASLASVAVTPGMPSAAMVSVSISGIVVLISLRMVMRLVVRRQRRRGDDFRSWLIVGNNARSREIIETINANAHFGIRIVDVVDLADRQRVLLNEPCTDAQRETHAKSPVYTVSGAERIREIVATRVIDEVVVTLPVRSCYDAIGEIIDICSEAGISVKLRPETFTTTGSRTEVAHVGDIPMVTHFTGPANYSQLAVKRLIDIAGATLGLALLSPAMLVISAVVKISSPGPVLFKQARVGLHGRHFKMLKFRSMYQDADSRQPHLREMNGRDGTAFKIKDDPRITRAGRFLRKYHLDELPQLWNVLAGDMSLVGPRPLPIAEADGDAWWQRRRLSMPPGITCLWQLKDDPEIPFQDWMRMDMAYIDAWSVWLDVKILFKTVTTVARGGGW
jgi:exopolysaccharide biosynthesis polyprenyl glycosylphosphotransferase